jgi:hypothetical protein
MARQIEVTPEMIDAGLDRMPDLPELLGPPEEELREAIKAGFSAMLRVHHENLDASRQQ